MKVRFEVLTVKQFAALLDNAQGSRFVGLQTVTDPKILQKDRVSKTPWEIAFPNIKREDVRKIGYGAATIGPEYPELIINRLEKEGKDASEYKRGDTWHVALPWTKCLRASKKTGEIYAWFAFLGQTIKNGKVIPLKSKVRFVEIPTGVEIPREKLVNFLPLEHEAKNQGLKKEDQVVVRTYKLESIRQLRMGGVVYTVVAN